MPWPKSFSYLANFKKNWFKKQKFSLTSWFYAWIIILGLIMVFLIPPFQKPDEATHFYRTIGLTQGQLVCQPGSDGVFQHQIPQALSGLREETFALAIAQNPSIKYFWKIPLQSWSKTYSWKKTNEPSACTLPALPYLPVALVLSIPVALQLNPFAIFYLGRLFQLAISLAISWYALKKTPSKLKPVIWLFVMTPMVLHQYSSFSKDALHLSLGLLSFSLLLNILEEKKTQLRTWLTLLGSLGVVILSRPQYLLFGLWPLILSGTHFLNKKISAKWLAGLLIIVMLASITLSLGLNTYSADATSLNTPNPNQYVFPELQLQYLTSQPLRWIEVLNTSFESHWQYYLISSIGLLGWIDYQLSAWIYLIWLGGLAYVAAITYPFWPKLNLWKLSGMLLIIGGTFQAVLLALYLYATPVAGETVSAVQGRYFLLLIPFIPWIISAIGHISWRGKIPLLLVASLLSISFVISARYYRYSENTYRSLENSPAYDQNLTTSDNLLPIKSATTFMLPASAHKKIAGVSILVKHDLQTPTYPYQIQVYDQSCQKLIRSTLITAKSIPHTGLLKADWKKPLLTSKEETFCVKIQPYLKKSQGSAPNIKPMLTLFANQDQPILTWEYIF